MPKTGDWESVTEKPYEEAHDCISETNVPIMMRSYRWFAVRDDPNPLAT